MTWLRMTVSRWAAMFRKARLEQELDEELRVHLEMSIEENLRRGMSPEEARCAARREFGGVDQAKEAYRDRRGWPMIDALFQDVRYGSRMLRKNLGLTLVAVLTLSLGIGVNTAIFTAYDAVALRPLQAKDPSRVVNIYRRTAEDRWGEGFTYSDYKYYRDHNTVFSGLIAAAYVELVLSGAPGASNPAGMWGGGISTAAGFRFPQTMSGSAEFLRGTMVSENYFQVLGVNAVRGRTFLPGEDNVPGAPPVAMLSENFFERRFGSDPALVGRTIKLNNASFTVVGITPRNSMGVDENVPDVWLPIAAQALVEPGDDWQRNLEAACCRLNARLKPGVSMGRAEAEMTVLTEQVRQTRPPTSAFNKPASITLGRGTPFAGRPDATFSAIVMLVMGAVGLVLLIACANVASLQLARSAARQKEIGVRLAIGAGRARLVRQLLTESALLAVLAGGVGLFLSWWTLRFLVYEISASLPAVWGTLAIAVDPDPRIFTYTVLISLVAGILFGLAPALEASKPNLTSVLKEEGAGFGGRLGKSRLRDVLVAGQIAVCLVLLISAGLLVRGSSRALTLDPGFETRRILGMDLELPPGLGYSKARQTALTHQLMERLGTVPGVVAVTRGRAPLAGGVRLASVAVDGKRLMAAGRSAKVFYSYVSGNHFETLAIPIVRGRAFTEQEARVRAPVILISEVTAKKFWPGKDPIGKELSLDASDDFHDEPFPASLRMQVIGVTKDMHLLRLSKPDENYIFLPLPADQWYEDLLVRTQGDPNGVIAALGQQVHTIDPNVSAFAESLDGLLTNNPEFVFSRIGAIFSTGIGLLGLALAAVGIYGMVSYAVVQRTHEVGMRMALGANRSDVLQLILRQSMRPVVLGIILGMAGAAAASHVLKALLFGLSALDVPAFLGVSTFLTSVAILASYLPARRATKVDPIVALRYE